MSLRAQLPLEPEVSLGVLDGAASVVLADLDRDGDLDAVVASGPDASIGEVSWFPFDSVSGWASREVIDAAFPHAKDLVAVDLDRDGDLDVAAVSFQDDELAWWENMAGDASTWSAAKVVASGADGAVAVTTGDVDGDGDPDLVAALRNLNEIRWFENDGSPGDGGWTSHLVNAAAFSEATGVALADLDGDGDQDLVGAARVADQIAWWESDGSPADGTGGDGTSWTFHSISTGFDGARDVVVGDLDRDGDLDVAAVAVNADQLVWFGNLGAATAWTSAQTIGSGDSSVDGVRDLEALDLDLDGDLDLLTAGQVGDTASWWENREGAAQWSEHGFALTFDGARGVAAGDVDVDGDIDLVATAFDGDAVAWWENVPVHRRVELVERVVAAESGDAVWSADIDRDGDLDVVGGGVPAWYERQGNSFVRHEIDSLAGLTGGGLTSVAVADLDGDGDRDVAGTNSFRVLWWENDGTPLDDMGGGLGTSWTRHQVSEGHSQAQGLSIADLDGDGALDLVVFDVSGHEVSWWESDGTPADDMGGDGNSWTERVIDGVTQFPRSALPRDIDRDGDLDVLVVSQVHLGDRVSFWQNTNGAGTSWTQQAIGAALPLVAGVEDVDRDGDLDVFVGNSTGSGAGTLELYEQLPPSDGTTWPMVSSQLGPLPLMEPFFNQLSLADLDLDGDVDAAVVGTTTHTVWYENPGTSSGWVSADVSASSFAVGGLAVRDGTGDGVPDLLAAGGSKVVIFENRAAQAELLASDVAVSPLEDDAQVPLLRLNARSLGRVGDSLVEIAELVLLLEEGEGTPLTAGETVGVVERFQLWEDDSGPGIFDPLSDTMIGELVGPTSVGGLVTFPLLDFAAPISTSVFRDYFLVVRTTADATAQGVAKLRVTLRTGDSRMEDVTYDAPLVLLSPEDVSTGDLILGNPLFRDGFESGDTSMWGAP